MWKKDETPEQPHRPGQQAAPSSSAPPRTEPPTRHRGTDECATIGRSIAIRGDLSGDEDLVIQGQVEGTVDLKQHNVTVGPEGRVKADIIGRVVTVEGEVTGNLSAQEQIALRSSARVEGDVHAPRVMLEDGATFRGSIDMSPQEGLVHRGPGKKAAAGGAAKTVAAVEDAGTKT
jgi:cytoskeletal protein CcmA (bactofilin family)